MGMLDFLKHDPEDDYDFDDEFDDDLDDDDYEDEDDSDDLDDEVEKKAPAKEAKKVLPTFSDEDDDDDLSAYISGSGSRFSQDYKTALQQQIDKANQDLRRRTADALEMIRQIADQPLPYVSDVASDNTEDDFE